MSDGVDDRLDALEAAVEDLQTQNQILENRLDGANDLIDTLEDDLEQERQLRAELEDELQAVRGEIQRIDDRTGLLDRVNRAAALKPEERAVVLIQTLYAKAERNGGSATMDASSAVDALGGDIDRTLMYGESGTFQTAVRLVGNEDVLTYITEDRASKRNSRLKLDLTNGELPSTIAGHEVVPEDPEVTV